MGATRRILAMVLPEWSVELVLRRWRAERSEAAGPTDPIQPTQSTCQGGHVASRSPSPSRPFPVTSPSEGAALQSDPPYACRVSTTRMRGPAIARHLVTATNPRESLSDTRRRSSTDRRNSAGVRRQAVPALVVQTVAGRQIVRRCCSRCRQRGVRTGLDLAEARMLLGEDAFLHGEHAPIVADFNPAGDARRLLRLAEWCGRFAPIVGTCHAREEWEDGTEPPGLLFDLHGCEDLLEHRYGEGDLHRNEQRFALDVEASLDRLGLTAFAVVADTVGLAWGVAWHRAASQPSEIGSHEGRDQAPPAEVSDALRTDRVVRPSEAHATFEDLPIEALRLDEETRTGLRQLHFEKVADLLAVDRAELGLRFGSLVPRRIAQALGEIGETVVPVRAVPIFEIDREFATPVQAREGLELAVGAMLEELCDRLCREEQGVERLRLVVDRLDLPPVSLVLSLSRASRRIGHLWSLLSQRMEEIDPGLGVERLSLRALRVRTLPHRQRSLTRSGQGRHDGSMVGGDHADTPDAFADEAAAAELADSIIARWGEQAVRRPGPIEAHVPETGDRLVPIRSKPERTATSDRDMSRWPRSLRPTLLRHRPDPIRIEWIGRADHGEHLTVDHELDTAGELVVWWRGRARRVVAAEGPERIAEPWWRRDDRMPGERELPQIREYWTCRFEGGLWAWVFREVCIEGRDGAESGPETKGSHDRGRSRVQSRWFLHGLWA